MCVCVCVCVLVAAYMIFVHMYASCVSACGEGGAAAVLGQKEGKKNFQNEGKTKTATSTTYLDHNMHASVQLDSSALSGHREADHRCYLMGFVQLRERRH